MALIDRDRRRRSAELKTERMERIVEAGRRAFLRLPFVEVDLNAVRRMADVPEGKPELYFGTREDLFIVILERALTEWLDGLEECLRDAPAQLSGDEAGELMVTSLMAGTDLLRLMSLAPVVLEQRLQSAAPVLLVQKLRDRLGQLGSELEARAPSLERGRGGDLLWRLLVTAVGLMPVAHADGHLALLLDDGSDDDLHLRLDLTEELRASARALVSRYS